MTKYWKSVIIILLIVVSCQSPKADFAETEDAELRFQVLRMKEDNAGDFQVRIWLLKNSVNPDLQKAMSYNTDSLFYLADKAGITKHYPVVVEPVNGVIKNGFEYLVSFEDAGIKDDSLNFVYTGKFLSKQEYILRLKNNK